MSLYRQKLEGLGATVARLAAADLSALEASFAGSRAKLVYAVGSGGSQVCTEYFRLCRSAAGAGTTITVTPLELVADFPGPGADVWLFSGGADNPDIEAAWRAAMMSPAEAITLVTANADGAVSRLAAAESARCRVHVLPVADPKDGFVATHSVVATMSACLLTSGTLLPRWQRVRMLEDALRSGLDSEDEAALTQGFKAENTLLVLYDPHLFCVVRELETSLLEAGLCNFQHVDLRNFAHGRHVWLDKRPQTRILALTGTDTEPLWARLDALLPGPIVRRSWRFGSAGPQDNFKGVLRAFRLIEVLGDIVGIDPARPGVAGFGRGIYEDRGLVDLARSLAPAVRHKRAAIRLGKDLCPRPLAHIHRERLTHLLTSDFRGVVLDYDGTIVETDRRHEAPEAAVVGELLRLLDGGMLLGIATGRGGSAGEELRAALPKRHHDQVVMGYYNGSLIVPLARDIADSPPDADPEIRAAAERILNDSLLRPEHRAKFGPLQITIGVDDLVTPAAFDGIDAQDTLLSGLDVRVLRSQHSIDIVRAHVSKENVVRGIAEGAGLRVEQLLCVGDSGERMGNDFELLDGRSSISVQEVCDHPDGTWTLFGATPSGPAALMKLLRALKIEDGTGRFDSGMLLDRTTIEWYKRGT